MLLQGIATVLIQSSSFSGHTGLGGATGFGTSIVSSASPGGGTIMANNPFPGTGGNFTIAGCIFENNTALTSGAALFVTGFTTLSVSACQFRNCRAWTGYGGAIEANHLYPVSTSAVSLTDSSFDSCTAAAAGGAVYVLGPVHSISVLRSVFSNSTAGVLTGPGGWVQDPFAFVQGTYMIYQLTRGGGALFITQVALLSIVGSSFQECTAPHSVGGALRLRFSQASVIQDCVFDGCSALSGGAVSLTNMNQGAGEVVEFANSSFVRNSAFRTPSSGCPGSYCIPNDDVLVPGDGGAVQINGCTLLLSGGCSFVSNKAAGRGGAIFAGLPFDNSFVQILPQPGSGSSSVVHVKAQAPAGLPYRHFIAFVNNSAGVAGGAIASRSYPIYISSAPAEGANQPAALDMLNYVLFQGNSAPTGGAISVFQTPVITMLQTLFYANHVVRASVDQTVVDEGGTGNGGAMCIVGSARDTTTLSGALLMNNSASFGGGLHVRASPTCTPQQQVDGCFSVNIDAASSFVGNSAEDGAGGGIFWSHPGNLHMACDSQGRMLLTGSVAAAGIADRTLPCASWDGNTATGTGYGSVIASTPFYLDPVERVVPFYTSNQPLLLNVTVQVSICTSWDHGRPIKHRRRVIKAFELLFVMLFRWWI